MNLVSFKAIENQSCRNLSIIEISRFNSVNLSRFIEASKFENLKNL